VQEQAVGVGDVGELLRLLDAVDGPELGGVGDRDHADLRSMFITLAREQRLDLRGVQLARALGRQRQQLDLRHSLGRGGLVHVEVAGVRRDDALPRARQRAEAEDVGGGAVEDDPRLGGRAEVVPDQLGGLGRPGVGAVGDGVVGVGLRDGREDLGVGAGVVVGGERAHVTRQASRGGAGAGR
jgi:hypothetical protein